MRWLLLLLLALSSCAYCDASAIPCVDDGNCPTGASCRDSRCCREGLIPCACQQLQRCDEFLLERAGFTASELAGTDPTCEGAACTEGCEAALLAARNLIEGDLGPCGE